jgi:hypothetical protein
MASCSYVELVVDTGTKQEYALKRMACADPGAMRPLVVAASLLAWHPSLTRGPQRSWSMPSESWPCTNAFGTAI